MAGEKKRKGTHGCPPGSNRGGGPKTEAGLERAKANFTFPPEEASLTHQGRRFLNRALAPSCRMCIVRDECEAYVDGGTCRLAEEAQAEIQESIMALPHIDPVQDLELVRQYAKLSVFVAIVDRYLSAQSPFLPGADGSGFVQAQPILRERMAAIGTLARLASELGLTPLARKRLQADTERGPAAAIAQVFAEAAKLEKASREKALEGEFEAADEASEGDPEA